MTKAINAKLNWMEGRGEAEKREIEGGRDPKTELIICRKVRGREFT